MNVLAIKDHHLENLLDVRKYRLVLTIERSIVVHRIHLLTISDKKRGDEPEEEC